MNKTRLAEKQRAFNDLSTITHHEYRGESLADRMDRAREGNGQQPGLEVESLAPSIHVIRRFNTNAYLHRDGGFIADRSEARSWMSRRAAERAVESLAGVVDSVKEKLVKARDWIKANPKKTFATLVATGLLTAIPSEYIGQLKNEFAQGLKDRQNGVDGNSPSERDKYFSYGAKTPSPEGVFGKV